MIIVIDKKQMYDSVIMGKGNASKEWNVLYWCFWQVLCLVMHVLCICLKTASWLFLGQGLFLVKTGWHPCFMVRQH